MDRLDALKRRQARLLAPGEEITDRPSIGRPGVPVADVGGEELDEALFRRRAGCGNCRRNRGLVVDDFTGRKISIICKVIWRVKCYWPSAVQEVEHRH
jgi:hypothetical protein